MNGRGFEPITEFTEVSLRRQARLDAAALPVPLPRPLILLLEAMGQSGGEEKPTKIEMYFQELLQAVASRLCGRELPPSDSGLVHVPKNRTKR